MIAKPAEQNFHKGLAALAEERPEQAVDLFLAAMRLEWRRSERPRDMRYLSYYGLSLARARHAISQALEACEYAVCADPDQPSLLLNLGLVYLLAGKRGAALDCFERGLAVCPGHQGLQRARTEADRRSVPPFAALRRSHPINRYAGRLRAGLRNNISEPVPVTREELMN